MSKQAKGRRKAWSVVMIAVGAVTLLVAGCGSSSGQSGAGSALPTATNGAPNLKGVTIRIAVGASPAVEDTKVELMMQVLKGWGADAKIINQTGDPAAIRVILAGDADIGSIAVSSAINSGLTIFGPSQPRLDYHFIGAPSLKSISDLPGHVYGTSNVHGLEALMFADLLAQNKIPASKVTVTLAGGASVRVGAMLTHHIDATFVHQSDIGALIKAGFTDLATMSTTAPDLADSFIGGSPGWVSAHPALAAAVDEAWIAAAKTFNDDEAAWVKAAVSYAGGTQVDATSAYKSLKAANTFPVSATAFSEKSALAQEALAFKVGAIKSSPPASKWLNAVAWSTATAAMHLAS